MAKTGKSVIDTDPESMEYRISARNKNDFEVIEGLLSKLLENYSIRGTGQMGVEMSNDNLLEIHPQKHGEIIQVYHKNGKTIGAKLVGSTSKSVDVKIDDLQYHIRYTPRE